ncbi:hypothetical protein Agub_g13773 [Astrephomene gubernaculifera]|uniref:Uncharacterized protein n=1 Tax=Astrephomene gubernaculifera TaxID=47775 RepID=A0AAD3HSV0_9CHLO|nr:hypothetical protein Agub_g13773 [Astrephomene gubernaculifera]
MQCVGKQGCSRTLPLAEPPGVAVRHAIPLRQPSAAVFHVTRSSKLETQPRSRTYASSSSSSGSPDPSVPPAASGDAGEPLGHGGATGSAELGSPPLTWMTCQRCKQRFAAEQNHSGACRYHSEDWTGGELAKAVGFVRQSDAPEHQLAAVMGRTGLLRFWDCCGSEDEGSPGCKVSFHVCFDDEVNERLGWR